MPVYFINDLTNYVPITSAAGGTGAYKPTGIVQFLTTPTDKQQPGQGPWINLYAQLGTVSDTFSSSSASWWNITTNADYAWTPKVDNEGFVQLIAPQTSMAPPPSPPPPNPPPPPLAGVCSSIAASQLSTANIDNPAVSYCNVTVPPKYTIYAGTCGFTGASCQLGASTGMSIIDAAVYNPANFNLWITGKGYVKDPVTGAFRSINVGSLSNSWNAIAGCPSIMDDPTSPRVNPPTGAAACGTFLSWWNSGNAPKQVLVAVWSPNRNINQIGGTETTAYKLMAPAVKRYYYSQGSNTDCLGINQTTCTGYGQNDPGAGQLSNCSAYCDACAGCTGFGISNGGCWLKTVNTWYPATTPLANSQCYLPQKAPPKPIPTQIVTTAILSDGGAPFNPSVMTAGQASPPGYSLSYGFSLTKQQSSPSFLNAPASMSVTFISAQQGQNASALPFTWSSFPVSRPSSQPMADLGSRNYYMSSDQKNVDWVLALSTPGQASVTLTFFLDQNYINPTYYVVTTDATGKQNTVKGGSFAGNPVNCKATAWNGDVIPAQIDWDATSISWYVGGAQAFWKLPVVLPQQFFFAAAGSTGAYASGTPYGMFSAAALCLDSQTPFVISAGPDFPPA